MVTRDTFVKKVYGGDPAKRKFVYDWVNKNYGGIFVFDESEADDMESKINKAWMAHKGVKTNEIEQRSVPKTNTMSSSNTVYAPTGDIDEADRPKKKYPIKGTKGYVNYWRDRVGGGLANMKKKMQQGK